MTAHQPSPFANGLSDPNTLDLWQRNRLHAPQLAAADLLQALHHLTLARDALTRAADRCADIDELVVPRSFTRTARVRVDGAIRRAQLASEDLQEVTNGTH